MTQQLNRSSQATMDKSLDGVCVPSHRIAAASLTDQQAEVSNLRQIVDDGKFSALITGATGFVGQRLAERLHQDGWNVRLLVRDILRLTPQLRMDCEVLVGDLSDTAVLAQAVQNRQVIFHCAANVSTWDHWDAYYAANVVGVENLLRAITEHNPALVRLVHVSTMDVYGFPALPCDELSATSGAGFGYGETKLLGEGVVRSFGDAGGISYTILRPGNVIGPGSQFIRRIGAELKFGLMLTVDGGQAHAGLVDVDNLVDRLIWAASAAQAHRSCFNVRDDYDVTWATFLSRLRRGIKGKGLILNLSFGVADRIASVVEAVHRRCLPRVEPLLHRLLVRFFGRTCGHRADKLQAFCPTRIGFDESMENSITWFLQQKK